VLALGHGLDAVLPDGGLAWGHVTELCVAQPSYATSVSLLACARAQAEGLQATGQMPWCAFIDPFASLYAPGVAQAGVDLEHLLVVRPPVPALSRIGVRLVEARAFALVVVDTFSHVARPIAKGVTQVDLAKWVNVVRRLNTIIANTHSAVLLITDKNAPRPLPLPVALRMELSCTEPGVLKARVAKEKHGRVSLAHTIVCRDFVPRGPEPVEGPAVGGS
jgi:recombination protein RecA